jgi:hypothetical protein
MMCGGSVVGLIRQAHSSEDQVARGVGAAHAVARDQRTITHGFEAILITSSADWPPGAAITSNGSDYNECGLESCCRLALGDDR